MPRSYGMASAELRVKLQKRLLLQEEDSPKKVEFQRQYSSPLPQGLEAHGYSPERNSKNWKAEWSPPPRRSCSSTLPHCGGDAEDIQQRIVAAIMERDEARHQLQSLEANAVSQSIGMEAEIARLRVDVEVLQRDLFEVKTLRAGESCRERVVQGRTANADFEPLLAQVQSLEQEVARNIIERVRLEGLLRESVLRETEAKRQLEALQVPPRDANVRNLADAEPGIYALNDDDIDNGGDELNADELEFVYEDAFEMYSLMPIDKALKLAQQHSKTDEGRPSINGQRHSLGSVDGSTAVGGSPQQSRYCDEASDAVGLGNTSSLDDVGADPVGQATVADDSEVAYEEPLRALQFALTRLRGDEGASKEGGSVHVPATPGTGELSDVSPFDGPLADLQQVIGQLGASLEQEKNPQVQAQAPSAIEEIKYSITPAEKDRGSSQPPVVSKAEVVAELDLQQPPLPLGPIGLNLMSPYARLGQRVLNAR